MTTEIQQSIFLESDEHELDDLRSELMKECVDVKAISVVDPGDFGVVRMVTTDPLKTAQVLRRRRIPFLETRVVIVRLSEGISAESASRALADKGVRPLYGYGGEVADDGDAIVVFRVSSPSRAEEALRAIAT